jgi:hypothetical protein
MAEQVNQKVKIKNQNDSAKSKNFAEFDIYVIVAQSILIFDFSFLMFSALSSNG